MNRNYKAKQSFKKYGCMIKYWSAIQSFPRKATVPHLWHLVCVLVMHVDINYRSVSLQQSRCATVLGSGGHGGGLFSIRPWSRQLAVCTGLEALATVVPLCHRVVLWGSSSATASPSGDSVTAMDRLQGAPLNSSMRLSRLTLMEGIS